MSFMHGKPCRMYHSAPPVPKTSKRYKKKVHVFLLMSNWIQVFTLERNSLKCAILEMQMTTRLHIQRCKMESSSVLITL